MERSRNGAFADIASSSVAGMNGSGTVVTDPMGEYIVLGDVSALSGQGVKDHDGAIGWALDPSNASISTAGATTTYTYEITYPITLDTAAEGFQEKNEDGSTKYYPTNGYTYLNVPQADGSAKQIAFNVPGVCGKIPPAVTPPETTPETTPDTTPDKDPDQTPSNPIVIPTPAPDSADSADPDEPAADITAPPMADVPETGEIMLYHALVFISGMTLLVLALTGKRSKGKREIQA